RLNTGPSGKTSMSAVDIRPSSADDDALRSLSLKLRDAPFVAADDSPAFFAASASDCAGAGHAGVATSSTTIATVRLIRGVILFITIGALRRSAQIRDFTRVPSVARPAHPARRQAFSAELI